MSVETIQLTLTQEASENLEALIKESNQVGAFLRIWVQSMSCSGPKFGMALDTVNEDDDITIEDKGFKIVVDSFSAKYLDGAVVEYQDDDLGGGFTVNNPNLESNCSCRGKKHHPEDTQGEEKSCQGCQCN